MSDSIVQLSNVFGVLKEKLPKIENEFDPLELEVEERDGIVVDYIINKAGDGYVLVIDDRDLTPELITLEFESGDAMVAYFEDGKRKPMVLDSVEN
ncbi:hypothetical protein CGH11_12870 [Vibrio parahaemolyticus]|uniref:hypothetical protein n=1 Tax=Gammaproteobacteria TaxID=1236 RepID=UPI000286F8BD|nr:MULTISPECIES: hypothetical protein [Gammaproteobacteria]AFT97443.1 hypothetical protein AMBAS45_20116 [Alteromonas macleodii str. 'Balearic Sea AD45']TOP71745.1 hypothetical protein CGH11_12870 [Vibrio parahaemolyticus]HDY7868864.1 hypothetical protein [Vibrio vulnificus]